MRSLCLSERLKGGTLGNLGPSPNPPCTESKNIPRSFAASSRVQYLREPRQVVPRHRREIRPAVESLLLRILEAFVRHHMAPMAGRVPDGQQNRLICFLGSRKSFGSPGMPIHRVCSMLLQAFNRDWSRINRLENPSTCGWNISSLAPNPPDSTVRHAAVQWASRPVL